MRSADDDVAFITGSVLKWARLRSGLSLDHVSKKIHASEQQVGAWERGTSSPPFSTAQELAKLFHVPFGFLFLANPPAEDLPLPDFRTLSRKYKPTPEFLELLNDVLVKQDWYRDYAAETGSRSPAFLKKFTLESNISDVAASIRNTLGITPALRQSVRGWSEYLSAISRKADEVGVLVMRSSIVGNNTQRKVSSEEVKGFAVYDALAPLIFVNSQDFKASQIFTTVHELAHIWVGHSAISNPDEADVGRDKLEAFCNRVAAETLVPKEEFIKLWKQGEEDAVIASIARWFLVSTLVVLRRAHDFSLISGDQFTRLKKAEFAKIKTDQAGGGDYYRNVVARMSGRLTYAVLNEVQQRRILLRDASRLLDMKIPTLLRFADTNG
jgi:Zn-dependent peptidase ImmA (M78 family)/DNA-binding XRE family transcriptional regulator